MAVRFIFFVTVQTILLQTTFSQCLNRMLPGCGQNIVEAVLPNQLLVREPGLPVLPGPILPSQVISGPVLPGSVCAGPVIPGPVTAGPVVSEVGYPQTVIQDGSVANSLANALQLLVVSSLLSSTLPGPCDAYPGDMGYAMPGYNYVY